MDYSDPIPERDLWTCAHLMIRDFGDDADLETAAQVDLMLDKGEMDGRRVWLNVLKKVIELKRTEPGTNEPVH